MELMGCQGLAVPSEVMHHVVRVESSYNPYAIGVVGGRLVRQPKNLPEALATVRMLEGRGFNFSIGLAQVNRYNLGKYGLDSYEEAFQPCANLKAGSKILAECYHRAGRDWGKSFSCYYSGNFSTGFRHGYVQKIYASLRQGRDTDTAEATGTPAIDVVGRESRRTVPVARHPLYRTGDAQPTRAEPGMPAAATAAPRWAARVQPVPSRTEPLVPPAAAVAAPEFPPQPQAVAASLPQEPMGRAVVVGSPSDPGRATVVPTAAATAVASPTAPASVTTPRPVDKARILDAASQDSAFVF